MGQLSVKDVSAVITKRENVSDVTICASGSKHIFIYAFLYAVFQNSAQVLLKNVPRISDTDFLVEYALRAGADINYDRDKNTILVKKPISENIICTPYILNCRSSLIAITTHLLRFSHVSVLNSLGGCRIGERKIDQHIKLWEKIGADVYVNDFISLNIDRHSTPSELTFDIDTTMGSAASVIALANGSITKINNASIRPEIMELINFISLFGFEFSMSDRVLTVTSVQNKAKTVEYCIPSDIDECLAWACFMSMTGVNGKIIGKIPYIDAMKFLEKNSQGSIIWNENEILISRLKTPKMPPCVIEASEFPGIGSDQQPIFTVWSSFACEGVSVRDKKFPNRFNYLNELSKHGWKYEKNDSLYNVKFEPLDIAKASFYATDLRAGFAFLLAGVCLYPSVTISGYAQLLRGYSELNEKLNILGFDVKMLDNSKHQSVAIILTDSEGKLYLQKRDDNAPKNPSKVSFFGGAVECESSYEAIKRELIEELELDLEPELIGEFSLNKELYSMSGTVFLYRATVTNITKCNEGQILKSTRKEALSENLTMFARSIIEML